jgi:hypothetical protein
VNNGSRSLHAVSTNKNHAVGKNRNYNHMGQKNPSVLVEGSMSPGNNNMKYKNTELLHLVSHSTSTRFSLLATYEISCLRNKVGINYIHA